MTSNSKTFSTAQLRCTNKALELHPPDGPMDVQSPGATPATPMMQGVLAMECTDPKCLSGTQPGMAGPPILAAPFQLDISVQITQGSGGQPCLLAIAGSMDTWVPIPVLDRSYEALCGNDHCERESCRPPCGELCKELVARREAARLPVNTKFYVYKITQTPDELTSLQDKLIAIPVLPGQSGNLANDAPAESLA